LTQYVLIINSVSIFHHQIGKLCKQIDKFLIRIVVNKIFVMFLILLLFCFIFVLVGIYVAGIYFVNFCSKILTFNDKIDGIFKFLVDFLELTIRSKFWKLWYYWTQINFIGLFSFLTINKKSIESVLKRKFSSITGINVNVVNPNTLLFIIFC